MMGLPQIPHDDWFDNPLDSMPIATDKEPIDTSPSEIQPPGVDQEEEKITMHEKMYRIATAKYNPFAVGGSEQLGGGSEKIQLPPRPEEEIYDDINDPYGGQ